MHRALRQTIRTAAPSLRRTYAGIKQDDPSLHPTGANSEAAKKLGPLANSQPATEHNPTNKGHKHPNATESKEKQDQEQQSSQQSESEQKSGQ